MSSPARLDTLITDFVDREHAAQTAFLRALVQVPSDNPEGNCGPHAVRAAELPDLLAAVAINSRCPIQPIAAIDAVVFAEQDRLVSALHTAWDTVPWDDI